MEKRINGIQYFFPFIYVLLLGGLYYDSLKWLVLKDWARSAYSYCYLVPFILLFLLWQKHQKILLTPSQPTYIGLLPLLLGVALFWFGELGGEFFTLYVSLWLVVIGVIFSHWGWVKLKIIRFPLFFVLTAFPLPNFLYTQLTLKLQLISSRIGTSMIQALGVPAYREGNNIDIGIAKLQVVEACSGLYSLTSLFCISLLISYISKMNMSARLFVILSSIPLSILVNSFRITMTAVLHKYVSQEIAESFFHEFSALILFGISSSLIFMETKLFELLPHTKTKKIVDETKELHKKKSHYEITSTIYKSKLTVLSLVISIFLGGSFLLINNINFYGNTSLKKPLEQFPLKIGDKWLGKRGTMEEIYLKSLDLSSYLYVTYYNSDRIPISLYIAYYENQKKGESIHSPATCLPGSGWSFEQKEKISLPLNLQPVKMFKINRALMQKQEQKELVYYWFSQRGRILTNAYQLKIYNVLDSLRKQRTDGALVRLITPVHYFEKVEVAEARLQNFTNNILEILHEHIPDINE